MPAKLDLVQSNDYYEGMAIVITIHEAKTHLSKYIKQAKAGQPVYIGSYGKVEVKLVPATEGEGGLKIGIWAHRAKTNAYKDEDIIGPDPDIIADFEKSINKPFPG